MNAVLDRGGTLVLLSELPVLPVTEQSFADTFYVELEWQRVCC